MSERTRRSDEPTAEVKVDTPTSVFLYAIVAVMVTLIVLHFLNNTIGIGEAYLYDWTVLFTYISIAAVMMGLSQKHLKQVKVLKGLLSDEPKGFVDMWTVSAIVVPVLVFFLVYKFTSPYWDLIGEFVLPIAITIALSLLWEYIERLGEKRGVGKDDKPEPKKNRMTDIAMSLVSCAIALFLLGKFGIII